jgi:hypothetical protein
MNEKEIISAYNTTRFFIDYSFLLTIKITFIYTNTSIEQRDEKGTTP